MTFREGRSEGPWRYLTAHRDGEQVGRLDYTLTHVVTIEDINVPRHRREGIARALLDELARRNVGRALMAPTCMTPSGVALAEAHWSRHFSEPPRAGVAHVPDLHVPSAA